MGESLEGLRAKLEHQTALTAISDEKIQSLTQRVAKLELQLEEVSAKDAEKTTAIESLGQDVRDMTEAFNTLQAKHKEQINKLVQEIADAEAERDRVQRDLRSLERLRTQDEVNRV